MKINGHNPSILPAILIAGMIFTSCTKKQNAQDDLIGTWNTGNISYTAKVGNMDLSQYLTTVLAVPEAVLQIYMTQVDQAIKQSVTGKIQINSDNTYSSTLGGNSDNGSWSLSSDGKTLTINSSSKGQMTFSIVNLSASTLELQMTQSDSVDLSGNNNPITIDFDIDASLTKV